MFGLLDDPRIDVIVGWAPVGPKQPVTSDTPTMIIAGATDIAITPATAEASYAALLPPKRYVEIESMGHNAFSDACLAIRNGTDLIGIAKNLGIGIPDRLLELGRNGCDDQSLGTKRGWRIIQHFTVAELRASKKADVIVISAHTGLDRDTRTGVVHEQSLANEQVAYQIAESAGADAVIFGHTHAELASYKVGDVLMMQPRNWGMSLGEMDITVERDGASWKISSKKSKTIPVTDATAVDESILAIGKPYHEAAEKYLSQLVAESPVALSTAMSRVEDTALIDAIQMVQMDAAKADVSFASAFNLNVHAPKGKISVRELAALYLYDNTLYAIEGNGKMVREALENSARFYFNRDVFGYNYDMAEGVTYEVDPSRPPGSRILNLKYKGQPLKDDQPLRLAVNNYRAGGSAGYTMFPNAKVVWRSSLEIREMMIDYFTRVGKLPAAPTNNWKLVGDRAEELISAARKNAGQPELQ